MNNTIKSIIWGAVCVSILGGCASLAPIESYTNSASVKVFRNDQLQGSVADVYVGWNDNYYAKLASKQYTELRVPLGMQEFKVKAHADISNELTLSISKGDEICLMIEANPDNLVGLNWFVPGYRLKQITCFDELKTQKYEKI